MDKAFVMTSLREDESDDVSRLSDVRQHLSSGPLTAVVVLSLVGGSGMRIVDAQIHLWGRGLPSNMAHRQVTSFTTEEAVGLMDEGGLVEKWRSQPGMLGLRYGFLSEPMRSWLADGTLDWVWAAAEQAGVPIAMLATDSLPHIGRIAERHPRLRLTIDHLGGRGGTTTLKDDAAMEHMPELIKLARHPNIAVKATGAPGYCSGPYPFTSMHTYLRQIYDAFGPGRMFWGTDITKMPCSWRQCVTMFTEELPWLPERDKHLVMGEAVRAWWGWT
jgi:predicted TIM-barrel fold metal-dependent hydrolase